MVKVKINKCGGSNKGMAKNQYDLDRNQNRSALSKKEQPN